jgi:hypothetical protein
MVQVPEPTRDALFPETLHTDGVKEENATGNFEVDVADKGTDAPGVDPAESAPKVIV